MREWLLLGVLLLSGVVCVQAAKDVNTPTYVVLIGPPGSGKGTIAEKLAKTEALPVLTVSTLLRQQQDGSPLSQQVNTLMRDGKLVPDSVVEEVLHKELQKPQYAAGAIFDGFPRTLNQTVFFQKNKIIINYVLVLDVDDDVIVERLAGRRVHLPSGRVYHVTNNPPATEGKDHVTGEALVQRPDDSEKTIRKRLADYKQKTEPVAAWAVFSQADPYGMVEHVMVIDANGSIAQTWEKICAQAQDENLRLQACMQKKV